MSVRKHNLIVSTLVLVGLAGVALAQGSPVAAPEPGEPAAHNLNPGSDRTSVTVVPDPAANVMADPQSAAEFGSPSAVDSPGSPMPNPLSWPAVKPSAKRPAWVKKAPPSQPEAPGVKPR